MKQQLLYQAVSRHNILPLVSSCRVGCVFCSNRYNPPGTRAFSFDPLSGDQVALLLDMLDGSRPIVIGESASLLCEGEPLLHPGLTEILHTIRHRFPSTLVKLTTSGIGLTDNHLDAFSRLAPLEVMVSLNSASSAGRQKLMADHDIPATLAQIGQLAQRGIPWQASAVLMPHLTGWHDVERTISFVQANGAFAMRLLLPGFSRLAPQRLLPPGDLPAQARQRLASWRRQFALPLTLEPSLCRDLTAEVAGVLRNSPAQGLLMPGDILQDIQGQASWSRVAAFDRLKKLASPRIRLLRAQEEMELVLPKKAGTAPGVVMDYDLAPADYRRALAMAKGAGTVLMLTSLWAAPLWRLVAPAGWQVEEVPSHYFGGTIAAAGLLTVADYRRVLESCTARPEKVLLPPLSFDHQGLDLTGQHPGQLEEVINAEIVWE